MRRLLARVGIGSSVRRKTIVVVLATALVALALNALMLVAYDLNAFREQRLHEARAQAEILGRAAGPALAFGDLQDAHAALKALKAREDFVAATLYLPDGRIFAAEGPQGLQTGADLLAVRHQIEEAGQRLGAVEIVMRPGLRDRLLAYAGILALAMILALGVTLLLSTWLQRVLTAPILEIDAAARSVVERRDFKVRARRTTDDEIGVLADAFNRMLDEVERTHAELQGADRRKDEFLATLAHELRNPLAPIRNALYLLKMAPSEEDRAASRDMIERQVDQMVRLIDDLIDVSRITSGKLALRRGRVDAVAVARGALEAVEPAMKARGHRLDLRLPDRPLALDADATRLSQVFLNLLSNAAKFTDPAGRIVFELRREGDEMVARVKDNGIGIEPGHIESIFEMFNQADRTLERAAGGLGVGLALSRRLVELHGGTVRARSEGIGKGAEFEVRIPAPPAEAPAGEGGGVRSRAAGERRRVLLVDDNHDVANSLAALLRIEGHEVHVEYEAGRALDAARAFGPSAALLDIGLPGLSGYELARLLRVQPETRGIILVAITGFGQPADRQRGREAGFDYYLVKPIRPEEVLDILRGEPVPR